MKKFYFALFAVAMVFAGCDTSKIKLNVNTNYFNFESDGTPINTPTIKLTSSHPWILSSNREWCVPDVTSGDKGTTKINITVEEHVGIDDRNAQIFISVEDEVITVFVIQKGSKLDVFQEITDQAFLDYCKEFDTDGDGKLSKVEAKAVTKIDIPDMGISSLAGIEYFTSLEEVDCSGNRVWSLDLSNSPALRKFVASGNLLSDLNLSGCSALSYVDIAHNKLSSVDLSGNGELTTLICNDNRLAEIDISNNEKLTDMLLCTGNEALRTVYVWQGFNIEDPQQTIAVIERDAWTEFVIK